MSFQFPQMTFCDYDPEMKALKDYECSISEIYPRYGFKCSNGSYPTDFGCKNMQSCQNEVLTLDISPKDYGNRSQIVLKWKEPYITHLEDYYAYDFQSFIGEVGGTSGLFLEFSFLMVVSKLEYLIEKIFSLRNF